MKELAKISRFGLGLLLLFGVMFITSCEQQDPTPVDIRRDATVIAVEKVMPSVVNLVLAARVPVQRNIFEDPVTYLGQPAQMEELPESVGSGVIIDEAGYILTSLHVVVRGPSDPMPSRVAVKLWDGREFDCDPIVAARDIDLALLKIHAPHGEKFQPIKFAQDDDLLLGETVIAIGNPLNLGGSVTKGILSSRSRTLPTSAGPVNLQEFLQTDAPINAGNSGGPLVNLNGDMIGLNEAVLTNQQNISFAIPVKRVQNAISQIFSPEVMNHIWLGARVKAGNGPLHFVFVQPDSPAYQAGIRIGDEVVAVNNQSVQNPIQFDRLICGPVTNQNLTAKLIVRRKGENYNATVQMISFDNLLLAKLGFTLVRKLSGIEIGTVAPDGPAAAAQLQPGMQVVGIDNQPVPDFVRLVSNISAAKSGDHLFLNLIIHQVNGSYLQVQNGGADLIVR